MRPVFKYILGTYAIGAVHVAGANKFDYHPKSGILDSFWNLPRVDTSYGQTMAGIIILFSPLLIPVYGMALPLLYVCEYTWDKSNQQIDQEDQKFSRKE